VSTYLPYIYIGIASGSVYALAAVGLVLTYKTSGTFNFAHGALGTMAAYAYYSLHVQHGVAWPLAAAVAVIVLGVALGFGFESFGRGLSRTPMMWRIAATIGILISIEGLASLIYGPNTIELPSFLSQTTFNLAGANVTYAQLDIFLISLVATTALEIYFRVTRTGIAMRAVVGDPDLLDMAGTNPVVVRRAAWIIGCTFATLSGLLLAPSVGLNPSVLTLLIIEAFGAAAIGGFSNIPLTYMGGIVIGVASTLLLKINAAPGSLIGGLPATLPFLVLFAVLVFAPRNRLGIKEVAVFRRAIAWRAPWRAQLSLGVLVVVALIFVPSFAGINVDQYSLMLTDVILLLSLGLLVRSAGQISLCQLTFAAIGATSLSRFTTDAGIPWFLALLLAGLIAIPIGAVLAIPAIRRSGLYLALATFGFGLLVQNMAYNTNLMFGPTGSGVNVPLPDISWLSSSTGYYYLILAITVVMALLTLAITRSRIGRLLNGVADSPLALSAQGANVNVTLVCVFCISAFMAAISGALAGGVYTVVSGIEYSPIQSLEFLVIVLIVVGGAPWYALFGALSVAIIPVYITNATVPQWLILGFGISVVTIALRGQMGMPGAQQLIDKWFGSRKAKVVPANVAPPTRETSDSDIGATTPRETGGSIELKVEDVTVRFGGLVAVNEFSLEVSSGRITGLIGPNGAGKSTTLGVCSGIIRPNGGDIFIKERSVKRRTIAQRARMGVGRTFQQMELFETLSVRDNLELGAEGSKAGARVFRQLIPKRGDRAEIAGRVAEAAQRCGLTLLLDRQVASLSTGQRRLVEFARCLAGPFRVLLLDEPSSGLDHRETEQFGAILRGVVEDGRRAILLVEHDMKLVMSVCDDIYVMDFGREIFRGTPADVRASAIVQAAYLGALYDEVDPDVVDDHEPSLPNAESQA
jgi:ABC-type branched-subunit amino acid transport system ATPase component/branched-subunit amino acid ABC-type transport system permease component